MRLPKLHVAALSAVLLCVSVAVVPARAAGVLDQLKAQFNKDAGVLRLVVLVSPTCPQCTSGAGWIQEYILKRYPTLDAKVYAVWYEMYPGDDPSDFPGARRMMPDKRVTHFWDQGKDVGKWFYGFVPSTTQGKIEWDAFYLFDKNSVWTDKPDAMLTWGRTILTDRRKLSTEIARLKGAPTAPGTAIMPTPPAGE